MTTITIKTLTRDASLIQHEIDDLHMEEMGLDISTPSGKERHAALLSELETLTSERVDHLRAVKIIEALEAGEYDRASLILIKMRTPRGAHLAAQILHSATPTLADVVELVREHVVGDCTGDDALELIFDAPTTWSALRDELFAEAVTLPGRVTDATYRRALSIVSSRY